MKGRDQLMSSKSDEWGTPQALFDRVNAYFHFDLDAAATPENKKCEKFFSENENALLENWSDHGRSVWCNPPYSKIKSFVIKAIQESETCDSIVYLVPARTDTKWFHAAVDNGAAVYFIKGRVRFVGAGNGSAPFPSCLLVFGKNEFMPPDLEPMHRTGMVQYLELTKEQRGLDA